MSTSTPLSLYARLSWRNLRSHPWQSVLMVVGVAIGVAVMVAIDLANASASRAFDLSTEAVVGKTTHQLVAGPQGIDEALFVSLKREGRLPVAAPVVTEYVASSRLGDQPMQLLGVDPFAEAPFRDYLSAQAGNQTPEGLEAFLTRPGAVLLSTETADRYGLAIGDTLPLEVNGRRETALVAGLLETDDALSRRALESLILTDLATAQEITGRLGRLDRVDLILSEELAQNPAPLTEVLPSGVRLAEAGSTSGAIAEMTTAFQTNLTALSLLALVVGMFLIYNTMTFSVVQRRALFGTLRSLGVTRAEIGGLVLGEAILVAVFSIAAGLTLGVALGQAALGLVTRTINDLYFVVTVQSVAVPPSSLVRGALVGLAATLVSAAVPAWEAASVTPRAALSRAGLEEKARKIVSFAALGGLGLMAAGALLLTISAENLTLSFLGTFSVIVGFALLTPGATILLMRLVTPLTGRIWGALGRMAPREVVNALSRTAIAVAALMVAVSVIIGVSVMVDSFRFTVVTWLSQTLQGDLYISPPSLTATTNPGILDPGALALLEETPGVMRVDTVRSVAVDSPDGLIQVAAVNNPAMGSERLYESLFVDLVELEGELIEGAVLVSEPLANRLNLPDGEAAVTLFTDKGRRRFPVAGIYFDYASSQGTVLMADSLYRRHWEDTAITAAALRLEENLDADALARELSASLAPIQQLTVQPNQALRQEVLEVFDRTFDITAALQLLATVVAFIGVLSALFSLQLEKQRQFGILRAIGLSVRQLWRLVLLETGLMGAAAGLIAIPTGLALSWILIFVINRRSFGWTLQMQVTGQPLLQAFAIAVIAALLAGIYPAWRISRRLAAESIRFE